MAPEKWPLRPAATAPPHCCRLPRHPSCDKGCAWRAACFSRRKGGLRASVSCPVHGGFSSGHWCTRPGAARGRAVTAYPTAAPARQPCRRAGKRQACLCTGGKTASAHRPCAGAPPEGRGACEQGAPSVPAVCRFQIPPSCRGMVARGAVWGVAVRSGTVRGTDDKSAPPPESRQGAPEGGAPRRSTSCGR